MKNGWRKFLLFKLPGTLAAILILIEALAFALEEVRPNRHDLDRLAIIADQTNETINSNIIVFGDSVTQDVFKTFRIGVEGQIANLTTNKASGIIGSYLLLSRYLQNYPAPETAVFAATPEFFAFSPEGDVAELYLSSVFHHENEQDFIDGYMGEKRSASPISLMHMEGRIGTKIISVLSPTPTKFPMGHRVPDPNALASGTDVRAHVLEDILKRAERPIDIPSKNSDIFSEICTLAKKYKFNIHIVFAPVPTSLFEAWKRNGIFISFLQQLRHLLNQGCQDVAVSLDATLAVVPDHMMRDADHLNRHAGTSFFATRLNELVVKLTSSSRNISSQ